MRSGVALVIWSLIVIGALVGLISALTGPSSQDVTTPFSTTQDRLVSVTGQSASAKLASSGFFVLRQGDRVVSGSEKTPPLGWADKSYFVADAENFAGTWNLVKADSTVTIQLQNAASAVIYQQDGTKIIGGSMLSLLALLVWLFGICLAAESSKH